VIAEYTEDWRSKLNRGESGWDASLYTSNGEDWDGDDDDDCYDSETDYSDDEPQEDCKKDTCCGGDCHGQSKQQNFHNLRGPDGKFVKKETPKIDNPLSGIVKSFADYLDKLAHLD
jgi:hypothetical protein